MFDNQLTQTLVVMACHVGRDINAAVMFDGTAKPLTDDVVRDIYGLQGLMEFNEAVTSTQATAQRESLSA